MTLWNGMTSEHIATSIVTAKNAQGWVMTVTEGVMKNEQIKHYARQSRSHADTLPYMP